MNSIILAVGAMSPGATAVFYFIAFVAFVVAGILSAVVKNYAIALISAGLALWVFVGFWNALAAS